MTETAMETPGQPTGARNSGAAIGQSPRADHRWLSLSIIMRAALSGATSSPNLRCTSA